MTQSHLVSEAFLASLLVVQRMSVVRCSLRNVNIWEAGVRSIPDQRRLWIPEHDLLDS